MTFIIKAHYVMLCSVSLLWVSWLFKCNAGCRYDECHYAKRHYAKWHCAKWHYAKWHYAKWHYADCCYAECRGAAMTLHAIENCCKMPKIFKLLSVPMTLGNLFKAKWYNKFKLEIKSSSLCQLSNTERITKLNFVFSWYLKFDFKEFKQFFFVAKK